MIATRRFRAIRHPFEEPRLELVPTAARTLKKALNRYVALTGDTRATMEDPVVRRFCDAYEEAEAGVLARAAAARTKRRVPALRAVPSRA